VDRIYEHFVDGFRQAAAARDASGRRIGAELKFPLVDENGEAAPREAVDALWSFLAENGWSPVIDKLTDRVIGARKPGPQNDTLASCETGYCKTEFSMAHVANLVELRDVVDELCDTLWAFSGREGVCFLGYGIQPKTPPSRQLLMKKARTAFWGQVLRSNNRMDPEEGDDVHLFTINATSQVHVDVSEEEAIRAVNVFNGLSGAQIALTADSSVWQGQVDPEFKCVCEMFWDWWQPGSNRVGVPGRPFRDMADYVQTVARMQPIYVQRDGEPIGIMHHKSFATYYQPGQPSMGTDVRGREVALDPTADDIDQHGTFYWYNARISRYYTLENRVNDQQPPGALLCVPALTLGLMEALSEAEAILKSYAWADLRAARVAACRDGLDAVAGQAAVGEIARRLLGAAHQGLRKRGLGEERFLEPLWERLQKRRCPADDATDVFQEGGMEALVRDRSL